MAYYRGLTLIGANTARIGVLPHDLQKHTLELLKPTDLGVPSFLKKLARELEKLNFDTRNCPVKKVVCIGESIRGQDMALNSVGKALEDLWEAKVFSTYASTETLRLVLRMRPAAGRTCTSGAGVHGNCR